MTCSATAARLEFAPGFSVKTQSSGTFSNDADHWVASVLHFGPYMAIAYELLRRD